MYRLLWKNRNCRSLLLANVVNRFGDSIDAIAFTWLTYTFTQSAALSAIVFAANMLPTVIFQPLAAPIVDKLKKRKVMIYADLARGSCLAFFIALHQLDLLASWMFVVFTFVVNSIEAFRVPAGVAFLPSVLSKEEQDAGINFNQLSSQVCTLAGTAAGGALVAVSPVLAMMIDCATFFLSALFIALIRLQEIIDQTTAANNYWRNLKDGFQYLGKNHTFLIFITGAFLCNSLNAVFSSLAAAFISGTLHATADYLSIANIIITVSSLVMMLLYPKLSVKLKPSIMFSWIPFSGLAIFYLSLSVLPYLNERALFIAWIVLFLVLGISSGMLGAFVNVMFVKVVEPAYLSRAAGVFNSVGTIIMPILSVLIAALLQLIEIPTIFFITGVFAVMMILIFAISGAGKVLDAFDEKRGKA
ncbi:MFS transporter [Massilicoli timonensis]|uniref:MFS transporter n=1 Tax=Massilicoli timonensis TaxID=2015901 RepID=UPI00248C4300|nr:MFS transporter [Massilicoli timonensis]